VEEQCRITNIIKSFRRSPSKDTAWRDSTTESGDSVTQRYSNRYYEHEIMNHSKVIIRYLPTVMQVKVKQFPLQVYEGPEGSMTLRLPEFLDIRHRNVVRFSLPLFTLVLISVTE